MTCGIYEIVNIKNNKKYIGQSVNIEERWVKHKRLLRKKQHNNQYLQNSWNKYGENTFVFNIIEECSRDILNEREQFWIQANDSYNNGYNLDNGGGGVLKYTKEYYYRVTKKGTQKNGMQRYQLIKDNYSKPIFTTIFKDKANKLCSELNNKKITEKEAQEYINQCTKKYRSATQSATQLRSLGINYLITQSSKGHTKKDIQKLHDIPQSTMDKFLKEQQKTWQYIYQQGEQLKIKHFDEKYNIQQRLINGATTEEIRKEIGCSKKALRTYKEEHNIKKPHSDNNSTNTGVQYLTLLSTGKWQYRRTHQNPNNITRTNFEDIKQIIKERKYLWIIHDEEKLQNAIKKSKIHHEIINNKKIGRKIHKKREYERHKQKFAKKRALKAFRKMFSTHKKKQTRKCKPRTVKSSTGITHLTFSKGDNGWLFNKPKQKGAIKRQNLLDLYNEVISQGYKWTIEDKNLFHNVIKEVKIYKKERKKPFLQRKYPDFKFI